MSTITSNGSGNWSTGGTWVGGVSPGSGDLAVLASGHTVTILGSDNITVGDGTAAHYAISGPGTLVCNDGFQLTLTASVKIQSSAHWAIGRGTITYTNASDGLWEIGDGHNNDARLDILGSSGTYGTIQSSSTGKLAFDGDTFLRGGMGSIRYYNLTKIGDATRPLWRFNLTGDPGDFGGVSAYFNMKNCTVDQCGRLDNTFSTHAGSVFAIDDNTWTNTVGGICIGQNLASTALASPGTRSISGNTFDGSLGNVDNGGQWKDITMRFNTITIMYAIDSDDYKPATFGSNLYVINTNVNLTFQPDTSVDDPNFLHIHSNSGAINNFHGLALTTQRAVTFEGWFIEPGDTDTEGDIILANSPASSRSHVVQKNVVRLNKNGAHGGQFISCLGGANIAFTVKNNTWPSSADALESGSCSYGETYEGHANIFAAIYNNLVTSPNSGAGYVFTRRNLRTFQDGAAAANIHHNGKYQLSAGTLGVNGYGDFGNSGTFVAMFSTTTGLGANDVTANPSFVDDTRGITTWAVARGYSVSGTYNGRVTDAYAAIAVDPRTRIPDLISWCRAGFAPTNAAFQATGSGGVDIGAVAVQGSSTPFIVNRSHVPVPGPRRTRIIQL